MASAASNSFTVRVRLKWWFRYLYLPGLMFAFAAMRATGGDPPPNWPRIHEWIRRGLSATVVRDA